MIETDVVNGDEIKICKEYHITGTGAITENILQVFGFVRVINQYAVLTEVTTLANATSVYADAYDGTNTELLTLDGAIISNFEKGSAFLKDQDVTQTYSVCNSSQVRVNETIDVKKAGKPFNILQKDGADTFIRFHLTTTDNPVDFKAEIFFTFERLSTGSNLVFL